LERAGAPQKSDSPLTALYVLSTVGLGAAQRRLKRPTPTRRHEEAVLKVIVGLADRYRRSIRTALRLDPAPEDAILRQARLGHYNLIVMGVGVPGRDAVLRESGGGCPRELGMFYPFRVELTPRCISR
jgi:nucleotide-binding universal stress UspA family protein